MKREHPVGIKVEQTIELKEPKKEDPDEEKPDMIKLALASEEDELQNGELAHGSLDEMEREMVAATGNALSMVGNDIVGNPGAYIGVVSVTDGSRASRRTSGRC